jgi:hypothetical protein
MTQPKTPPESSLPQGGSASTGQQRTKDGDHQDRRPKDHPQAEPATRRPSADSSVDESGRSSSPGGIESPRSDSDEDSRSRRRDLGP